MPIKGKIDLESQIRKGNVYETCGRVDDVPVNGGVAQVLIETGAIPIVVVDRAVTTNSDEAVFMLTFGVEAEHGERLPVVNINMLSNTNSAVKASINPINISGGIELPSIYIPGVKGLGQGQDTSGEFRVNIRGRIIPAFTKVLATITNNGHNFMNIESYVMWVEDSSNA